MEMTNAFSWIYLPHTRDSIDKYSKLFNLGGVNRDKYIDGFLSSKPVYDSFEEFIHSCNQKSE